MKGMFALVGMKHRGTEEFVAETLEAGEPLTIKREPTNKFDNRAIQVWARGRHIGYVASSQNKTLAAEMDAAAVHGTRAWAVVLHKKPNKWPMIEILGD